MRQGENVIATHVYYQGLINRVWNSGDYRQGMIAEVMIDGKTAVATDSTWKYTLCEAYTGEETIGYETQFLEHIDNRLMVYDWREIGFDDSGWSQVTEKVSNDYFLVKQQTPSVDIYEIFPETVEKIEVGHYLIDFGHEVTGRFIMKAMGVSGQSIEIRCGEELEEGNERRVRYQMRCNCTYREFWTLSGRKEETLEFYDYRAFRYVEIIDENLAAIPETFSAEVRHYPLDLKSCTFNSSNTMLNRIWDICKEGVKYGAQEGFLDCPSREKGQYLGDMTISAQSHIYLSNDLRLTQKAIKDFALSSYICEGLMAVAPGSFMQEIADFSLQWPMQLLMYYKHSGDIEFLREMYPYAERIYTYFRAYERNDGLLENVYEKWNLVDWPPNLRDGYDFKLDDGMESGCHNVINAFYYGMVKTLYEIRDILKIKYYDNSDRLKNAFVKAFYNKERMLFVDSEKSEHTALQSNILPLLFDMVPEGKQDRIVKMIRLKGLNCGVYMAYFVLKALAKANQHELLYELLSGDGHHSWGNMVNEGATTCFEAWGKDQKRNTSLCHAWASTPILAIIEDIVGLSPALPSWEEILFRPRIPKSLKFFELTLNVRTGTIKVEYRDGEIKIEGPTGIRIKI